MNLLQFDFTEAPLVYLLGDAYWHSRVLDVRSKG
jgi:hypothetical protein